jgi:VWFA-related protein
MRLPPMRKVPALERRLVVLAVLLAGVASMSASASTRLQHHAPLSAEAPSEATAVSAPPPHHRQQQQRKPPEEQQQQLPRLEYETGVDVILIDVNVVDAGGRPVEGLTAGDFKVSVNGRPRQIHTVQFVEAAREPKAVEQRLPQVSSNRTPAPGRLFMLVMDETNLTIADARALDEPLEKFLGELSPVDRVGLVTIPAGGPRIDFTTDFRRIRRAVTSVMGLGAYVSPSRHNIGLAEALLFEARAPEWTAIIARECGGQSDHAAQACQKDVETEARMRLGDIRYRASASLGALLDTVESLRRVGGHKYLVLLSGGMVLERQDGLTITLAEAAAAANATIYVLHLERPFVDAGVARPSPTLFDDIALGRQGLEVVAGRTRGEVFSVPTSSAFALERIATEASGYYLIGIEAEPGDRDGRAHQVRVELTSSRRGLTLRSRREFRFDRIAAGRSTDEEKLATLMSSPVIAGGVPLSAGAYTLHGTVEGKRRVLIAVEIDEDVSAPTAMVVACTITDASGREHVSEVERVTLSPVEALAPSPLWFNRSFSLDPGEYTVKVGVVAPDGRRGSIEHKLTTKPTAAGRLALGDLFVLDVPEEGAVELRGDVISRIGGRRLAIYCEVYAADPDAFLDADVTIEILAAGEELPVLDGHMRLGGTSPARRTVQGAISTGSLMPGDYIARLTVRDPDGATGKVERLFRITEGGP